MLRAGVQKNCFAYQPSLVFRKIFNYLKLLTSLIKTIGIYEWNLMLLSSLARGTVALGKTLHSIILVEKIILVNDIRSAILKNEWCVFHGLMYKECNHCTLVYKKTGGRRNWSVLEEKRGIKQMCTKEKRKQLAGTRSVEIVDDCLLNQKSDSSSSN